MCNITSFHTTDSVVKHFGKLTLLQHGGQIGGMPVSPWSSCTGTNTLKDLFSKSIVTVCSLPHSPSNHWNSPSETIKSSLYTWTIKTYGLLEGPSMGWQSDTLQSYYCHYNSFTNSLLWIWIELQIAFTVFTWTNGCTCGVWWGAWCPVWWPGGLYITE